MHLSIPDSSTTREAMIADVRDHYDLLSPLYRTFWGEHLHHGFWNGDESTAVAQTNLIQELARRADVAGGERVLDIGCGLGGSALFLAAHFGAEVTGISISPKQIEHARGEAGRRGLADRVNFHVRDAHRLHEDAEKYDIVWVIECSEHLFDKPEFIRECASHLAPGGRLAICAWLSGDNLDAAQERTVEEVRVGMLCASFGTLAEYAGWMRGAGLRVTSADDVTDKVCRTWALCRPVLNFPLVKTMLAVGGGKLRAFADSFAAIDEAYHSGAMRYGMFVAQKQKENAP
jgi:tocopherol O-methyltransferase